MTKRPPSTPPPKTRTLPESMRGAFLDGPDVVTALRLFGTRVEFALAREAKVFTIGASPDRDVALPDGYLSRLHCVLERRGPMMRVVDQNSHNGTFFLGRREQAFELRPGDLFTAGPFTFLAVNDEMRAAYPTLVGILGPEEDQYMSPPESAEVSPSAIVVLATAGRNILLTGGPGCGQEELARTIHMISLLRGRDVVVVDRVPADRAGQREILDRASRSTLILKVEADSPVMDPAFTSSVFSTSYRIRVVAIAPTVDKANAVLTEDNVRQMRSVHLPSLAFRTNLVPPLLDHRLAELASPLRFSEMTLANQDALRAFGWPNNLDDLRLAAQRLHAIATERSLRKAAEVLGLAHSTLHHWCTQVGVTTPLLGSRSGQRA